jgi:hypothetical protein
MLYQKTNERCCVRSSRLFAMACLFGAVMGAQTAVAADEPKEELITIGTRTEGRTALESLAPIDLITSEDMHSTGATETGKQLQMAAPSFGSDQRQAAASAVTGQRAANHCPGFRRYRHQCDSVIGD